MTQYDCTADVLEHKRKVKYWMTNMINLLAERAKHHDDSKLKEYEKPIFDVCTPKFKELQFGSDEYKAALAAMGEGLKHHYANNRHHPEHFENGVSGMTILDLLEMVCDWMAAAEAKNTPIDMRYLTERFKIDDQLTQIIRNTLKEEDYLNAIDGVPVIDFIQD